MHKRMAPWEMQNNQQVQRPDSQLEHYLPATYIAYKAIKWLLFNIRQDKANFSPQFQPVIS